jgi:hypothetical protein
MESIFSHLLFINVVGTIQKHIFNISDTVYPIYTFSGATILHNNVWDCGIAKIVGALIFPHDITCAHMSGLLSYHRSTEDCPITGFFLLWLCFQPQTHVFQLGVLDYRGLPTIWHFPTWWFYRCCWTIKSVSREWSTFPFFTKHVCLKSLDQSVKEVPCTISQFFLCILHCWVSCLINLLITKSTHLLNHSFIQYSDFKTKPDISKTYVLSREG